MEKQIPKLRFPEFKGEWVVKKLSEVAEKKIVKNKDNNVKNVFTNSAVRGIINQRDYFDKDIANQNNLLGYYIVERDDFVYNPRISNFAPVGPISRNHMNIGIMSPLYSVFKFKQQRLDFIELYFNTSIWHKHMEDIANYGARDDRMSFSVVDFYKMPIYFPSILEQTKIANFLTSVDKKLTALKQKKTLLEQYKKGVIQKIFSQQIRLKDQNGENFPDWITEKLGELTFKVDKKNKEKNKYPIYSINNIEGFLPQSDQFDGMDSNDRGYDISLYKIIESNTFAYNPARINVGSIGFSGDLSKVIISSLYVCFKTKDLLEDRYLMHYTKTIKFNKSVHSVQEGGVRLYLFFDNFSKISIPLPCNQEQIKIANFLSSIDEKIGLCSVQIEKMGAWKKGLLQQMFC
jgi:type I restriction enzyme S subunit